MVKIEWDLEESHIERALYCIVALKEGGRTQSSFQTTVGLKKVQDSGDPLGYLYRVFADTQCQLLRQPGIPAHYSTNPELARFPFSERQFRRWLEGKGMGGSDHRKLTARRIDEAAERMRRNAELNAFYAGAYVPTAGGAHLEKGLGTVVSSSTYLPYKLDDAALERLTHAHTITAPGGIAPGPSVAPSPLSPTVPDSVVDDPDLGLVVHTYLDGSVVVLKDPDTGQSTMLKPEQFDFIRKALTKVKQARAKAKAQAKEDAAVEEWLSDEDEMVF